MTKEKYARVTPSISEVGMNLPRKVADLNFRKVRKIVHKIKELNTLVLLEFKNICKFTTIFICKYIILHNM